MLRVMRTLIVGLLIATFSGSGCSKDKTGSAPLSEAESGLFAHLPGNAQIVFGGSYTDFVTYWKDSPLQAFFTDMFDKMGGSSGSMGDYMSCWADMGKDLKFAGSMRIDSELSMQMIMTGAALDVLEKCAAKGDFKVNKDDDGKYLELTGVPDGLGGTTSVGYYLVDSQNVLFSMSLPLANLATGGKPSATTRAGLEAVLKEAHASPASKSDSVAALLKKADASRAFWFAGSAAGTPIASELKGGHGWFDAEKTALSFGFTVELTDPKKAAEAVTAFKSVSGQLDMLAAMGGPQGGELKTAAENFLKDAKLDNDGGTLTGRFKITNDFLNKVLPIAKSMGAMAL